MDKETEKRILEMMDSSLIKVVNKLISFLAENNVQISSSVLKDYQDIFINDNWSIPATAVDFVKVYNDNK